MSTMPTLYFLVFYSGLINQHFYNPINIQNIVFVVYDYIVFIIEYNNK